MDGGEEIRASSHSPDVAMTTVLERYHKQKEG
jgi:hypothetical protein